MKQIFTAILGTLLMFSAQSQNIAINESGNQPDTSAMLDISSTTKGFLTPRMTKAQRNAIALPATGLIIFQTGPDSAGFHYYNGTQWSWLATSDIKNAWALIGNSNTDSTINFIGTTDNKPVMLRQNNLPMGQLNTKAHNFFIGGASGKDNTSVQNTGYGDSTLAKNTNGQGNTAVGYRAMTGSAAVTGSLNTAVGINSLAAITTGIKNVAVGESSMANVKEGNNNIAIGSAAMENNMKGEGNIALGTQALHSNDSSSYNIAIGHQALYSNDSTRNIGIGYQSLYFNNRRSNIAIGHQAGMYNNYLQTNPSQGVENTYLGFQSGHYANTGSQNVAIGSRALVGPGYFNADDPANLAYKRNVAIGDSSMVTGYGSDNVAVGYRTLSKASYTGAHVAIGSRALTNSAAPYPNVAIGFNSQDSNTVGVANTSLGTYSLNKNKEGYNNTAIGNSAMQEAFNTANPTYMMDNTAVGNDALRLVRYYGETGVGAGALRNDTGSMYNTAIGYLAMYNHRFGNSNTALGTSALRFSNTSIQNTALGVNAMYTHKRGDNNVAVGMNAMFYDTASYQNTAVGVNAMLNHKSGDNNTALGTSALYSDTSGGANVAIGAFSMYSHVKNHCNTAVGFEAMQYDKHGSYNTSLGWRSLRYAKNPDQNTAIGVGAIEFGDSAMYNVGVGRGAMMGKGGRLNTAIGVYSSGMTNGAPTSNFVVETTTLGAYAGYRNYGNYNTFVGSYAAFGASTDSLSGIENTGVGAATLYYNTSGKSNTTLGIGTMYSNTTGSGNTAIGTRALGYSNGSYNIALGDSALFTNNANDNVALGAFSQRTNNTGTQNVTTGNYTLANNITGSKNTAIGHNAFSAIQSGSSNTALGYSANAGSAVITNATAIGANAFVGQNNSMVLGSINGVNGATADTKVGIATTLPDSTFSIANNFSVGSTGTVQYDNNVSVMNYMFKSGNVNNNRMVFAHSPAFSTYGLQYQDNGDKFNFLSNGTPVMSVDLQLQRVGIGMTSPMYQLQLSLDGAAKLLTSTWATTSDMRLKTLDGNYTKGLQDILKLNTIMYHYAKGNARNLSTKEQGIGFSAQDVQKVFPEAVTLGEDGYYSLNIHPILIAYVNAFKEQQQEIEELKKKVEEKTKDEVIEQLMKRIEALEAKTTSTK